MRRLLFMTDYSADPIWDLRTEGMVDLDRLPLAADLRADVRAWARRVDTWGYRTIDEDVSPGSEEDREHQALEAEGHALWLTLRERLQPDYLLAYVTFGEAGRCVQWQPDQAPEPWPPNATDLGG